MVSKKHWTGFESDEVVGLPRNAKVLFNWGNNKKTSCELDESFASDEEYVDEIRRLQGNVMPVEELGFGMHTCKASDAGIKKSDIEDVETDFKMPMAVVTDLEMAGEVAQKGIMPIFFTGERGAAICDPLNLLWQ